MEYFLSYYLLTSGGLISSILNGLGDVLKGIVQGVWDVISMIFFTGLGELFGQSFLESCDNFIVDGINTSTSLVGDFLDLSTTGTSTASQIYGSIYGVTSSISTALAIVGTGLVIMWAFINLLDNMTHDRISGQLLLRWGLTLITAIVITSNSETILLSIQGVTQGLSTAIINPAQFMNNNNNNSQVSLPSSEKYKVVLDNNQGYYVVTLGGDLSKVDKGMTDMLHGLHKRFIYGAVETDSFNDSDKISTKSEGYPQEKQFIYIIKSKDDKFNLAKGRAFGQMIVLFIVGFLMQLVGYVLGIYACSIAISRAIQIFIYAAIAPIAIADLFQGGLANSPGMKFLKRYLGLCLQGSILLLVMKLGQMALIASGDLIIMIAVFLCYLGLINKSQQIANDIFGV